MSSISRAKINELNKLYGSPKIIKNLGDLKTHQKTYEALSALCDKVEVAVHNKNMDVANKLVEEIFVKLQKMKLKRPISANEFTSYLNNKDKILKFTKSINGISKTVAEVMKYEGIITKTYKAFKNLNDLCKTKKKKLLTGKVNELKQDREEFKSAYKKMKLIMSCADIAGEFAPAGISSYIEFNVKFFENAEVAIKIFDKCAEQIVKMVKEDMGKLQKKTPTIARRNYIISTGVEKIRNLNEE